MSLVWSASSVSFVFPRPLVILFIVSLSLYSSHLLSSTLLMRSSIYSPCVFCLVPDRCVCLFECFLFCACWRTSPLSSQRSASSTLVMFLGYVFSAKGVKADPTKVMATAEWPVPYTCKALQRFLGFTNFYRQFIRNFSQAAAPLTALDTTTKVPFCWNTGSEGLWWIKVMFHLCHCSLHSSSWTAVHCWGGCLGCQCRRSSRSCLSSPLKMGRCIPVPFFPIAQQSVIMILVTGSCWQSCLLWGSGAFDFRCQRSPFPSGWTPRTWIHPFWQEVEFMPCPLGALLLLV